MNVVRLTKGLLLILMLAFASSAYAVKPGEEEKKECKKPKFRDFYPAHKSEMPPESEISFHVNKGTDLTTIKAEASDIPMSLRIDNRKIFAIIHAKLPPELQEGFVRIHILAKPLEGDCIGQDGWLIKVVPGAPLPPTADGETVAAPAAEAPESAVTAP